MTLVKGAKGPGFGPLAGRGLFGPAALQFADQFR